MTKIIYIDEWLREKGRDQLPRIRAKSKTSRRAFLFRHASWY